MDATTNKKTLSLYLLEEIVKAGGPEEHEYDQVKEICDLLSEPQMTLKEELEFYEIIKPLLSLNSMLGFTFLKPYGYSGDFELIERIHNKWVSDDEEFSKWDVLYHELECSKAVRNRKQYYINELTELHSKSPNGHVLNLGSGPCTDLYEYLTNTPNNTLSFDCLDMDSAAIEHSKVVCDNYYEQIRFINKNVFRHSFDKEYSLIWSAGLFDYFSDKLFVRLLKRMYSNLKPNGEMIIGNFSPANPSRALMELFGQWYLNHRDEKELHQLAIKAGVSEDKIDIRSEKLGINLFLHIKK